MRNAVVEWRLVLGVLVLVVAERCLPLGFLHGDPMGMVFLWGLRVSLLGLVVVFVGGLLAVRLKEADDARSRP